ncbi:hypothetical protein C0993_009219 [Termitomyces sp. T159_Od127]|nr:hypothetical protein C0993_009219 [Termitomyces sp. T159_Od127]
MGFFAPSLFAAAPPVPCQLSFRLPPPAARPARPLPAPRAPPALPLELVVCIMEHAAFADGTADAALLGACALVCRAWALAAQKLLFTSVALRSRRACSAFLAATDPASPRARILAASVVCLRAVVDHNQPDALTPHALARAVARCPHLYDLALALYGRACPHAAPPFDDAALALLRGGPRISSLALADWSADAHALPQLLAVWPSVHALSLAGTTPPVPCLPLPFPGALAQLRLNFQSPPSPQLLHWLTRGAPLRVLELDREPPAALLQALVDAHAPALRALALPACTLPEHVRAVRACVRLCELRIENPCVLPQVWRALPPAVRHVALGVDMNTLLQPLVDLVRARGEGGGGALRAVTVLAVNGGERHALFDVLRMVCAFGGVRLRVVRDVRVFREQLRGDPIPPSDDDFPRERSLRNMYTMRA